MKISLHETGDYREQYHHPPPGVPRVRVAWKRPPEHYPGWTFGYRIHIPETELRIPQGPYRGSPPDVWLAPPEKGWTAIISVLLGSSGADVSVLEAAAPPGVKLQILAQWPLPNGEAAVVAANRTWIDPSDLEGFRSEALEDARKLRPQGWTNVRALYSTATKTGVGMGLEIAIPDSSEDAGGNG